MNIYPFNQCAELCEQLVQQGARIHQQFLCGGCGAKQTMEQPNSFFMKGQCEECGHITDLVANGCNYMVVMEDAG